MIKLINAYTLSECLDALSEEIVAYEEMGQRNVIFCEDRLTLVTERALMRTLGGTFLTQVTTFSRFLKTTERILSREGSVMAVGKIMLALQAEEKLHCFTSSASVVSGAKCIYEQLAQFAASGLSPEDITKSAEALPEDALKNKMTDLALIYEAYDAFLREEGYLDEGKYLTLLPECIKNTQGMSETNVFFLCHPSFTKQAKRALWAAFESAKNVVGIFIAGMEEIYTNQAYMAFDDLAQDFAASRHVVMKKKNVGKPLEGEAEQLRKTLFATEALGGNVPPVETDAIRTFAASDKTGEAECAAVYIRKALMENPDLHYRDFAVLTPSVDEYTLAIRKAFSEYAIPYSMDERISLKQHPLAKFILAVMDAVREGYSPKSIDAVAKNIFFGESDAYRNYLLKYGNYRRGVFGKIKSFPKDEDGQKERVAFEKTYGKTEALIECKRRMETALSLFGGERYGREYCQSVRTLMNDFNVGQVLNELLLKAEDEGMRSYLSQIEKKLDGVLAEAEMLMGGKKVSLDDFYTLLADGLEATEIAPNPLRLDAVFVGDITDSRIERIRVLFALGMTDALPRASDDANLITDQDKRKLEAIETVLEPMVEEVNKRNRESMALNLCAFTDKLYLIYSLGSNGEEPALSDVFRYVGEVFLTTAGLPIAREKGIAKADFAYRCSALAPAVRQLLLEKNDYEERKTDSKKEYSAVYVALQRQGALPAAVEGTLKVEKYLKKGEELFLSRGPLSASLLETYFSCPYQCFAEKGLYLEERQEQTVLAVDTGNFIHKLLELVVQEIHDYDNMESFQKHAEEIGRSLMNDEKLLPKEDTLAGVYSAEKLLAEGVQVAGVVYKQIQDSSFGSIRCEMEFLNPDLKGKIDRVDENADYMRIVDYKTGAIHDDVKDYYTGQNLQMQLYMDVLRGESGKIPAAVLYFPASVSYSSEADGKFRMKGFLNSDVGAIQAGDTTLSGTEKSEHFDAGLVTKKPGKAMPGDMFTDFLDYATYVSASAREELRQGFIAPSPVMRDSRHNACTWCKFGGMCGFHKDRMAFRKIPSVSSEQVVEIVRKEKDGK
ncbi:MAG: exodeoxyribonuclease V subunit gamma [Clostridia bacterium]|nr:exodeoxyribonuclease V subunit gamma [Clostridia bacterium]